MSNSSVVQSPGDMFLEKTFLMSGYLTGLGYGAQLVIYMTCMHILWRRERTRSRMSWLLMSFITILCVTNTIWTATAAYGLQLTYINAQTFPGGIPAFLVFESTLPDNVVALAGYVVGNVLADGLLLWRCRVIWMARHGSHVNYVMILPTLMLLASIALSILFSIESASPNGLYGSITITFATPYFGVSLSLNVLLTFMIVGRIWYYQRQGKAVFGEDFSGDYYTSISTMFVESAALYSITALLLLVTFALDNPINQIWFGLAPSVQVISNYLIIYRIAQGRTWNTGDSSLSTLAFDAEAARKSPGTRSAYTETSFTTTVSVPLRDLARNSSKERISPLSTPSLRADGKE